MTEIFLTPGGVGHLVVFVILAVAAVFTAVMFGVRDYSRGEDVAGWVVIGVMGPVLAFGWPVLLALVFAVAAVLFVFSPVIALAVYFGRRIK